MNILVTGGAGYIGSHTAKALARSGLHPIVFDNLARGHRESVQWGPFLQADLADRNALERTLTGYRIDAVVHFAGFAYVGESMRSPGMYFLNNTANTLNSSRRCGRDWSAPNRVLFDLRNLWRSPAHPHF